MSGMDQSETADEIVKDLYLEKSREARRDLTRFFPWKDIEHFPKNGNEGLYGFTYRIDGKIHLREDLEGEQKARTQIHESIHTPDEYETRVLTEWIMGHVFPEEPRYKTQPPKYFMWVSF